MNKMNSRLLILILGIGILFTIPGTDAGPEDYVKFSVLHAEKGWQTLTIDETSYTFESEDLIQVQFDFIESPWNKIAELLEQENFFTTEVVEDAPFIIIEAEYQGDYNKHEISHINIQPEVLTLFFEGILQRVSGIDHFKAAWPVDIQVVVMESFPEQYGVSALIVRGGDMLDYVVEENVTLYVSPTDITSDFNNVTTLIAESTSITLAGGGDTTVVNFKTFSVGEDYRPEDLHFTLVMDNGMFLYDSWSDSELPLLGHTDVLINAVSLLLDLDKAPFDLPVNFGMFLVALIALPILKKRNEIKQK